MNLSQYDKKNLQSIEKALLEDASDTDTVEKDAAANNESISQEEANQLSKWAEEALGIKVKKVKVCVFQIRLCLCLAI